MSMLDYPALPSFVIFTGGCNFKCSFCHNSQIVLKKSELISEEKIFTLLEERIKFIDAVVVTGGEPTIYGDKLIKFIEKIKAMDFLVKLDTNGTNPEVIKKLINQNLIDYIAMDIKGSFERYSEISKSEVNIEKIKESIKIIENSKIDFEFRTTVYKEGQTINELKEIKNSLNPRSLYILQPYKHSDEQLEQIEYTPYSEKELKEFAEKNKVEVRVWL